MADAPLGKLVVAAAGTAVRLTANQSDPAGVLAAHSYMVEALPTNAGPVYVASSSPVDRVNLTNVIAIIPPPATNIYPAFSATDTIQMNAFNMADRWIDADVNGDGVLASYIQA